MSLHLHRVVVPAIGVAHPVPGQSIVRIALPLTRRVSVRSFISTKLLPSLVRHRRLSTIKQPEYKAAKESPTNYIPQRHGNTACPDELSYTEVGPVEHADGNQKIVSDGMLVAQSYKCPL